MAALKKDGYIKEGNIINGRELYSKYFINGQPTVLFEAGMGDRSDVWSSIQDEISLMTSTFSYDRAGTGRNDLSVSPRTCADLVDDLFKLLNKVSVKPPFILVSHSFGGLVSRLFASRYPNFVIGMILVDAAPEYKEIAYEKILPGHLLDSNREYYINPMLNAEKIDKKRSYKQIENHKGIFAFPLTVITRGLPDSYYKDWPNQEILEVEQKLQVDFMKLSNNSKTVIAQQSRHYIQHDEPELVVDAIAEMVSQYRK